MHGASNKSLYVNLNANSTAMFSFLKTKIN